MAVLRRPLLRLSEKYLLAVPSSREPHFPGKVAETESLTLSGCRHLVHTISFEISLPGLCSRASSDTLGLAYRKVHFVSSRR